MELEQATGLTRIHKINAGVWLLGAVGLGLWKLEWGLAFGVGGGLGFLNFFALGTVVRRFFSKRAKNPLLLGFLYVARLAAVLGVVALLIWKLDMSPPLLVAGLGTILVATVIDAIVRTARGELNEEIDD